MGDAAPPRPCSIISSDCSIRSDLDASFDSRARYDPTDSDSLSYSDDSSGGEDDDLDSCYGWYNNDNEGHGSGSGLGGTGSDEDGGGIFF